MIGPGKPLKAVLEAGSGLSSLFAGLEFRGMVRTEPITNYRVTRVTAKTIPRGSQ